MRIIRSFIKQGNNRLVKMTNQSSSEFSYLMMGVADAERLLDNWGDKAVARGRFVGTQEGKTIDFRMTDPTARGIVCEKAGVFRFWMSEMGWEVPERKKESTY